MKFEDTISFVLAKATIAHRNALENAVKKIGLHSGQVFILIELWKRDGQRQIDLAVRLKLSAPTVNKILGGLLEHDFVVRERLEDDARSTRIFLTDKGHDIRKDLEERWTELESETLACLTETESIMLQQLLTKLLNQGSGEDDDL